MASLVFQQAEPVTCSYGLEPSRAVACDVFRWKSAGWWVQLYLVGLVVGAAEEEGATWDQDQEEQP